MLRRSSAYPRDLSTAEVYGIISRGATCSSLSVQGAIRSPDILTPMPASNQAVPLVAVDRGAIREATHYGHVVVVDGPDGIRAALGQPDRQTYFRSSAKPFQALAALRAGIQTRFHLQPEHVAVMAASHSGETQHVALVREVLDRAGVPEAALQCGAHWPLYEPAADALRAQLPAPLPVHNNCSGKHAGMLAAARALEASLENYLHPDHPVQVRIRDTIQEFTGVPTGSLASGIDGCSAPNAAVPLHAMARAFATLVQSSDPDGQTVIEAMTRHPFLVAGTDRFDTSLMEVSKGRLVAKGGAAGVHCCADRGSGQAIALKFESGDGTWVGTAVLATLHQLGRLDAGELQALQRFARPSLRNHRRIEVGRAMAVFELPL